MNIAEFCISRRVVTLVMTFVALAGGLSAYQNMARLEDPEFTIKDALIITPYTGASAQEVEEEVTDELELAVQQLGQLDKIVSKSDRGLSTLTVSIINEYDKTTLPQVWDELRRKVADADRNLPPGAGPSIVVDDYGDVFGVFFVVYGAEYSYAELKKVVDLLRRELALVQDVAKVATYGERREVVYVELVRDRMAQLGISEQVIAQQLGQKNGVANAGRVEVGPEFITIEPSGGIDTVEDLGAILIRGGSNEQIYLRDVATVRRGYVEPASEAIRYDGNVGIGIGISTIPGGNVVTMGDALLARMTELASEIPLGIEFGIVSVQSTAVTQAISGFVVSLGQAVVIVVVVLLFFMGLRSGLLIGFVLVLSIAGSFIFLQPMGVALERISLGALIIALGMLVDNAIVVVDGMLIKLQEGVEPKRAATEVVAQSATPLLGATIIAILAFAAIGTSEDSTGEFCRSLFQVVMVSLSFSWVTAVTVTPLLGVMFLKVDKADGDVDPYAGGFYRYYKSILHSCIRFRWVSIAVVLAMFATSLWGFQFVEQSFFPQSTRPQFIVDFWLPQGTHINETTRQAEQVEDYLLEQEGVTHTTATLGKGALRFLLTYAPEKSNPSYAQFLVDVDDAEKINVLMGKVEADLSESFPDALSYASKFQLGPGSTGKVQARLSGPDTDTLRSIAGEVQEIMHGDPVAKSIRTDWRQRVKLLRPIIAEEQANLNGIERPDIARALLEGFEGAPVGLYREGDLLLPIVMRAAEPERSNVARIRDLQIWSPAAQAMIPLRQVVSGFETVFEDATIIRRNRRRTIIVYCDPNVGASSALFARLRPQIEALELPPGYVLEWGGEYEDSKNAQGPLIASLPFFVLLMILILIGLFNSIRQPVVIFLCVPLAMIGVTVGLLVCAQPFGFMAMLGVLSLSGMLIKNAVVLIDQINLEISQGKELLSAIVDSGVSRLRPVGMAASTTALGMMPLLTDAFFAAMAVTVIFGLIFASVLTMIVVPVLYAIFFNVPNPGAEASQ
ncbi:MAG: multidrug efflux pump subunit AcrB [Hyphomicrobiaceae bacterium]|jgi:multidrug efflux pump subunit AcrB